MGEMFWPCYRRDTIYQLIPKVLFRMNCTANATSKTIVRRWTTSESSKLLPLEKLIVESELQLLENQSRETARSRMKSSTLCLEVPNNGLAIDGEKLCGLALFIRQRSWLSMKCILWQHDRFIYVVFI